MSRFQPNSRFLAIFLSFFVLIITSLRAQSGEAVVYEAELNYAVIADVGSIGTVGIQSNSINSNGQAIRLFDNGDAIAVDFDIPETGSYLLKVWLRCGDAAGATRYWPNGYLFSIPGIGDVNFVGSTESVEGPFGAYGTSHWGLMEAEVEFNSPGEKALQITSNMSWAVVDYLEVEPLSTALEPVSATWTSTDIGSVGVPGSATIENGTLTIQGSGVDIWNTSDGFHYYYKSATGDIDAIAKVESITNEHTWTKGGIMIRESVAANSRHAMAVVSSSSGGGFQMRHETGGQSGGYIANGVSTPAWVRVQRTGNVFRGYYSYDGESWVQMGQDETVNMGANVLVGFCLTSHANNALSTATITETNLLDLGTGIAIPQAPLNLSASEISSGEVQITWTDSSDNEEGFVIERKANTENFELLDSVEANQIQYTDSTTTAGNSYTYRLSAYNIAGTSAFSNESSVTIETSPLPGDLALDLSFSGNANDASGTGNNANVHGATLTTDRHGQANKAYQFDGIDDNMEIDPDPSLNLEHITLSAWIYVESYKNDQRIITKEKTPNPANTYSLLLSGSEEKNLQFRAIIGGTQRQIITSEEIPLQTWTHVAGTYDGSAMRVYINGQQRSVSSISGSIDTNNSNPVYIGMSPYYPREFHGSIDEVKIYNRGLSGTEIQNLYESEAAAVPESPSGLSATIVSNEVQLTWTDNADNEEGFVLERSTNSSSYEFLDSLSADATTFIDENVGGGTTYSYRIAAYNGVGLSTYAESTEVQIPAVPQGDTIRYEIEEHYTVVNDVGSNGDVGVQYGNAVRLFDLGDALSTTFSIPTPGDYRLRVWVRSGGSNPTNYWPDAYLFSLGGTEPITFIGDESTVEGPFSSYGTSHWGFMEATVNFSTPGSKELHIEANSYWLAVDYIEVIPIHASIPLVPTELTSPSQSLQHIELTWTDNSDNEEGFILERQTGTGDFEVIDTTSVNMTAYTDLTVVSGSSYTYRISAYNSAGQSQYATSQAISIPASGGWTSTDIGSVGAAGSVSIENGTLTIRGSGEDIWGTADEFHYYYQSLTGDIDARVKINSLEALDNTTKAGLMIRESTAAGSKHVSALVHAGYYGVGLQRRTTTGGTSQATNENNSLTAPVWLRMVKSGNNYTAYRSADGEAWTQVGATLTVSMTNPLIGFAITSNLGGTSVAEATITETNLLDLGAGGETPANSIPNTQEYQALIDLYNSLNGAGWTHNTNWTDTNLPLSAWHGVTVVNGDVTEINLPSNNLRGTIPRTIHLLEALKVINVGNNQIKGELPVQLARLPELEALYLNDNELGGVIDLEFSVMPKLKTIHLQNNNFRSIPDYSFNDQVDKGQVTLKAENNKLEFLYIENNLDLPTPLQSFTYIPQKPYGEPKIMGFIAGNTMELKVKMLGEANVYQWERYTGSTWTTIGSNSPNYEKISATLTDAGRYRCRISNTIEGTGFEIVTEEIEVKVDGGYNTTITNLPVN